MILNLSLIILCVVVSVIKEVVYPRLLQELQRKEARQQKATSNHTSQKERRRRELQKFQEDNNLKDYFNSATLDETELRDLIPQKKNIDYIEVDTDNEYFAGLCYLYATNGMIDEEDGLFSFRHPDLQRDRRGYNKEEAKLFPDLSTVPKEVVTPTEEVTTENTRMFSNEFIEEIFNPDETIRRFRERYNLLSA